MAGSSFFAKRAFNSTNARDLGRGSLRGLVSSGLPLERALTALSDEADDETQSHLAASLRSEVNAGSGFAKALAQQSA